MRCAESEKDIQENFTFNLIFSWLLEKHVKVYFLLSDKISWNIFATFLLYGILKDKWQKHEKLPTPPPPKI